MFRAHVLIIRKSKLYYTISDIITPSRAHVHETCARDHHLWCDDTRGCVMQFCKLVNYWDKHTEMRGQQDVKKHIITLNTGLFEMIVGVLTAGHLVLQMQPHVISLYVVTSRIRFMFLLFPQESRNWRYESEPPLKPSPLTCYTQFRTNSIIVFMFV